MTIQMIRPQRMALRALLVLLLAVMLCLFGCGGGAADASETAASSVRENADDAAAPARGSYEAPPMATAEYHGDRASVNDQAVVDVSGVSKGYIAISAKAENRLKVQIVKGDMTYTYDLARDGTPSIYPLQCGNGSYYYSVLQNISGTKYARLTEGTVDVKLENEFVPFLRTSDYSKYTASSECVAKAAELTQSADTSLEAVGSIYEFLRENITYDKEKAKTVNLGYLPYPDETLSTGKGICFDYASLACAMLRSQGIPTKLVVGYVAPNDIYHAWNMFYTEETGWVTASFQAHKDWNRIDITFSAGGAPPEFVGSGDNYADVYYY